MPPQFRQQLRSKCNGAARASELLLERVQFFQLLEGRRSNSNELSLVNLPELLKLHGCTNSGQHSRCACMLQRSSCAKILHQLADELSRLDESELHL